MSKKPTLDDLVRDERRRAPNEPDWAAMESKLFARIDEAEAAEVARPRLGGRGWAAAAGALALAASAMLFFGRRGELPVESATLGAEPSAGTLSAVDGAGQVLVGGQPVQAGRGLVPGDRVDAQGARGLFENAGKVTFAVEDQSRVRVDRSRGTVILALESGAVEAAVVPVSQGEAFAVDVPTARDRVRVAVHGTHLRVAREGDRVVVDLTEGVVSIGRPPREGSTYGTLVVAPAHIELDASRLDAGITVDHATEHVRKAASLAAPKVASAAPVHVDDHEPASPTSSPRPGVGPAPRPKATDESPRPTPTEATSAPPPASASVAPVAAKPELKPKDAVVQAVRSCVASRVQLGQQGVRVTVSSTLHLRVGANGSVESARFDPPLDPEVQTCAAATIYATRFGDPGPVTIPIEVGR
jgi:hypothetical protein